MTPERWAEIKAIFTDALARDPDGRSGFVATRCGADEDLREAVERLLASHEGADGFIETSPVDGLAAELVSSGRFRGCSRGPYRLGRRVAVGGMGEIYESQDVRTGQRVAIKVLTDDGAAAAERLKREAGHALELNHPHICRVYEVGEDEAGAYIAMEFLDGTSLADAVPPEGFDAPTAVKLAHQLADAVAHAHARGIIHRDLKSGNVMLLPDGRLKVLDFGLARRLPREVESAVSAATFTDAGVIAGTLSYLAPEVLKGEPPDCRSDVWAFGIVLHELLTGRPPFEGHTPFELTAAVLREPAPQLPSRVPAGLRIIHDNCLAKNPAERYGDGGELLAALGRLQSGLRVRRRTKHRHPAALVAAAVLVIVAVAAMWSLGIRRGAATPRRLSSVAVLPFSDASVGAGQEYFGDGVTEALIDRLGMIDTLRVFSHPSVMRFRDETSLAAVRRDLHADAVVRGSIERRAGRVRLTAELDDTLTERPLWHDTYERSANEVLALENDVARAIVERLGVPVSASQQSELRLARAVDPVVYEAYLQGRFQWNKRTGESLEQAATLFSSAIARDPTYAPAHAALADCYNQMGTVMVGTATPIEMRPRAKSEAIVAIQIDESLAEPHATLGYVSHYDWDWPTAEREFRRAIELNPNLALAHTWYANYLVSRNRIAEAIAEVNHAEQLDPFSRVVVTNVGWTLSYARRADDAIAAYRRALALDPTYVQARERLGTELAQAGRFDEALAEQQKVMELTRRSPYSLAGLAETYAASGRRADAVVVLNELLTLSQSQYVTPFSVSRVYFALDDRDSGFAWLERAYRERSNGMVYINQDRVFDRVRDDRRYRRLLDRVGLSDAW